jgi:hypothetical protein
MCSMFCYSHPRDLTNEINFGDGTNYEALYSTVFSLSVFFSPLHPKILISFLFSKFLGRQSVFFF